MKKIFITIVSMVIVAVLFCSCAAQGPMEAPAAAEKPAAEEPAMEAPAAEEWVAEEPASDELAPSIDQAPVPAPAAGATYDGYESGGAFGDTESYIPIEDNNPKPTDTDSLVTFSLKVDTASYTNVQRYLEGGSLPPADAVKVEEMINYFNYESQVSYDGHPLGVYTEIGQSPFDPDKYMAFIRVKAAEVDKSELPPSSLTFLIDTSGSMDTYDKLPLLKEAFSLLTENLDRQDRVSIVTYAGSSAVVLDGARGDDGNTILTSIYNLRAGGSTAGAQGIQTAYQIAERNFIPGGNNRVILATDGDFNVGVSSIDGLSQLIGEKRDSGIYLSVLGFGTGNIQDDIMETLSKDGNGNYAYINSVSTAKKVLVDELGSNLFALADDVKAQVEFNPVNVASYRLVGYENRKLNNEDFNDDTKDAGEIGVGTDVVMLFELELANPGSGEQDLKYGGEAASDAPVQTDFGQYGDELFEVRIRYKNPGENESNLILRPVTFDDVARETSSDLNFACSVAELGMQMRNSPYAAGAPVEDIARVAMDNIGGDTGGYRTQHLMLVKDYTDIAW